MSAQRLDRVRELLKREIGEIIRRDFLVEDIGVVSVNLVKVTSDLRSAIVFVSVMGDQRQRDAAIPALNRRAKAMQGALARAIVLRYTPKLRFFYDESTERGDRVLSILDELEPELEPDDPLDEEDADDTL